ncbi:S8 family serine peptidase [Streptomyces sp. NPDC046909]|uniref:S8 family peptidase n=1 Tax=Streptomyces sp. NPDC046909 TaxID=3155617 RepID=UPI0033FFA744
MKTTAAAAATAVLATVVVASAQATPVPTAPSAAAARNTTAAGGHRLTLVTGDRVTVDAKGRVTGFQPAEGRQRVPVQIRRVGGHTLVLPTDASRMIASGKLDQRLFDVTELTKAANRRNQGDGVKVIVGYKGGAARAVKSGVRDAGTAHRTFAALGLDSVQTPAEDTPDLWKALTDGDSVTPGISHVWLDTVRKASLDKSVPQIGAPAVWAKGYDGKGVKVAVLDTGIDTTHPDLKGQVTAAKNFTSAATTGDKVGHGTHVASTIAGTGAKSGGKYKGVAPGAKLLNGKVLDDSGEGDDSSILAGMEWAAEQGADIISLSLGGTDMPGVDSLESTVDKLSEEKGILFTIAAGNEGDSGAQTIDSPGSAADALTVGAVDVHDKLADFSSLGPTADGALKPDVTAPGVDITAASAKGSEIAKEYGENPPGYVTISGTSMATPHVAGAAALLKQAHPDWTFKELKAALVGSARNDGYSPYAQGSGRIQVDKALDQSVIAETSSLSFPVQQWPHTDDTPVTQQLTYRNLGTKDVTLTLSDTTRAPGGKAAPAGFFTLGADKVTVPAGGRASVAVTVNAKPGGSVNGMYSAYVTATGGGLSVRTAVGVEREPEAYSLTVKYVNRPGQTPVHLTTLSTTTRGDGGYTNQTSADTVTFRVPKGDYMLDSLSMKDPDSTEGGVDWLAQPVLRIDRNTTVTLDLNTTKAPDITVPDAAAKPLQAMVSYEYQPAAVANSVTMPSFSDIRLAHVGPARSSGLVQVWSGQWTKGSGAEYDTVSGSEVTKLAGTHVHHYKASELATVKAGLGASATGRTGALDLTVAVPVGYGLHTPVPQQLPTTRTLYLSTGGSASWYFDFEQYSGKKDDDGAPISEASSNSGDYDTFTGGRTYRKAFDTAVFAPRVVPGEYGVFHGSDGIYGRLPLFADGNGQAASSDLTSARTTLYRNGKKVGTSSDALTGQKTFKVPGARAAYRLTATATRSAKVQAASTRVDASWTFHSKSPSTGVPTELPVSTIRFKAPTGLDGRVVAGRTLTYPVTVEGAAKGGNLKSLAVYVSYDHGRTWKKTAVHHGRVSVKNPAKGKGISLRAVITDKKGDTSKISVYDAYYGK